LRERVDEDRVRALFAITKIREEGVTKGHPFSLRDESGKLIGE
jgi:hypothetical protein